MSDNNTSLNNKIQACPTTFRRRGATITGNARRSNASLWLLSASSARRWRIFFRFVWLGVIVLIAAGAFTFTGDRAAKAGKHTTLVDLQGEISSNGADIAAFEDDNTAGVILRINSSGGSPVQAGIMFNDIRRLRAKYPKTPLYVVVDDMCVSGGYYVAAADKIYVDKASIVGSIGVLMDGFGFTGLRDRLGIQRCMHTSGANKGAFDPFSPETPTMMAAAQDMLDQSIRSSSMPSNSAAASV